MEVDIGRTSEKWRGTWNEFRCLRDMSMRHGGDWTYRIKDR